MLTRVLFALTLICGMATTAAAEDAKVLALGVTDHEVDPGGDREGRSAAGAAFQHARPSPMCSAANLKKGDTVEIALFNEDKSLLHNTQTLTEDQAKLLLQAGKRGVPAGGWPEGSYQRQGHDHARRQDADRAELEADRVRVGRLVMPA